MKQSGYKNLKLFPIDMKKSEKILNFNTFLEGQEEIKKKSNFYNFFSIDTKKSERSLIKNLTTLT